MSSSQKDGRNGFGNILTETSPSNTGRFTFAVGEFDIETGLLRFHARYLMTWSGTWMSEDPIRFVAGQTKLNSYVGNDPINFTDPSGLAKVGHHWVPVSVVRALRAEGLLTQGAFEVGMGAYSGWLGEKHTYGVYGGVKHSDYNKEVRAFINKETKRREN